MRRSFKNALVCGGSGFIGSNFIRYIYRKHPQMRVFNFDLLTYAGNQENLADVVAEDAALPPEKRRYYFIHGDICDEQLLERIFAEHRFDLVVNFAAESHVDRSIVNGYDFIRTNIEGVRSLIEAVRKFGTTRFVQISTDEIYGSVPEGFATEETPFRPSNPYSSSKAGADLLVQAWIKTHQIPALIVRGSNNFGPYQYPEKLIPLAITNMIEGKKIPVHGTGEHTRSWVHVQDFCAAIDLVAHEAPDYSIYNAGGAQKTNLGVLELLAHHLGKNLAHHRQHVADRPGADMRYALDSSKIKNELGWIPQFTLENAAADLVSWYVKNPDWWGKIKATQAFQKHYHVQSRAQYY
jgi:dTDP-glucose 4,6-dehydratase